MAMSTDASPMMSSVRLRRPERDQVRWQAQCTDELLPPQHRARTVWAVVCGLDLARFCEPIKARDGTVGRDATDPRVLVALWLYASLRGVGSARELARLCVDHRAYRWICGELTLNHHLLSDFRVQHADALDRLFADVIATLVKKGLVTVRRISQDGLRVRACAGSASFRRGSTLAKLRDEAQQHLKQLRELLDHPERSAGLSAKQRAARQRAARQRQQRIDQAIALIPKLQQRQARSAKRLSRRQKTEQQRQPRASTTDCQAQRMKMGDGGYRPAVNVQIAADTDSRAIVAVDVTNEGVDYQQSQPMRQRVEQLAAAAADGKVQEHLQVQEHLYDGGYVTRDAIERAAAAGVTIYAPVKPPKNRRQRPSAYEPCIGDSAAVAAWRARMGTDAAQQIYKQRASTSETINAQMRRGGGLTQLTVRGLRKAKCVALWAALAYNLTLFGNALIG
jgi:transposase